MGVQEKGPNVGVQGLTAGLARARQSCGVLTGLSPAAPICAYSSAAQRLILFYFFLACVSS